MPRVTISLTDSILNKVDNEAHKNEISRSEYVANAIESYIIGSNQTQIEVMQLKHKIADLENQVAEKDLVIKSKSDDVIQAEQRLNQAYADTAQAKNETTKYETALKIKDDEIIFLRGHVSQLTQSINQFALKPGEEEIKKKSWWHFWGK